MNLGSVTQGLDNLGPDSGNSGMGIGIGYFAQAQLSRRAYLVFSWLIGLSLLFFFYESLSFIEWSWISPSHCMSDGLLSIRCQPQQRVSAQYRTSLETPILLRPQTFFRLDNIQQYYLVNHLVLYVRFCILTSVSMNCIVCNQAWAVYRNKQPLSLLILCR